MRVLITNRALDLIGGTEATARDLAVWLLRRGHQPVVYAPHHGPAAAQLRQLTVPVTDDLATIGVVPDVIHGNSSVETMTALLHFADTPAIFICHSWKGDSARAPRFPRILRYVAVDDTCADRLLTADGVPAEKLTVLLNAVDMTRFPARSTPLPLRPRRALLFGNSAHAANHLPIVEEACRRAGIKLDVVGEASGTPVEAPEELLGDYDLIFAKAKCALEGMASGAAVILCDVPGLGGMVSSGEVERLRRLNFGIRSLSQPLSVEAVSAAIAAYDPVDAARVSQQIRGSASSELLHQGLLSLYESVITEHASRRGRTDWREESRAAAAYLHRVNASRPGDAGLNLVVRAAHRLLRTPLLGRALTRVARWIVDAGRAGGNRGS